MVKSVNTIIARSVVRVGCASLSVGLRKMSTGGRKRIGGRKKRRVFLLNSTIEISGFGIKK